MAPTRTNWLCPRFVDTGYAGLKDSAGWPAVRARHAKSPGLFSVNNVERFGSPRVDLRRYP
jgi:hypothetical protein